MAASTSNRLVDRLKAAKGFSVKERFSYCFKDADGVPIETIYFTPLTIAERERIRKVVPDSAGNEYLVRVLLEKAETEDGLPAFSEADIPALKREIRADEIDKCALAIMQAGTDTSVLEAKKS